MGKREPIPKKIQRKLRQESGFGCAICGLPIFDYDHIIPYSKVKVHKIDNLVLLCPNHHRSKGNHLDVELIKESKKNPFNKRQNVVKGFSLPHNRKVDINIGSLVFKKDFNFNGEYSCLWVNGLTYFKIHFIEGFITISIFLTDSDGKLLLKVEKGELTFSAEVWDFVYEGRRLTIRSGLRKIIIDMILTNYEIEIIKGFFIDSNYKDGFIVENNSVKLIQENKPTSTYSGGVFSNLRFGSIGVLNRKRYPNLIKPSGWGSFHEF